MTDLFEIIETLPLDVQNVLGSFEREGYDYETCAKYLAILEPKGYTFEYDLDGTPFNLTKTNKNMRNNISKQDFIIWDFENNIPAEPLDVVYHYTTLIDIVNDGLNLNKTHKWVCVAEIPIRWQEKISEAIEKTK
jgi:hypothetical protein